MASSNNLPTLTRYIADNDDSGGSFFSDAIGTDEAFSLDLGGASARLVYTNDRAPAQISNKTDLDAYKTDLEAYANSTKSPPPLIRADAGSNVWFVDTPPGGESPMHRTISIDYVIQVVGQSLCRTSDDDTRTLNPGDVLINRATLHKWTNPSSTQWSRIMAVMTQVQPVTTKAGGTLQSDF